MILEPKDFKGEFAIGQREQQEVALQIQAYIETYEPKYLAQLLGAALTDLLEEAYKNPSSAEERYKTLAAQVKPMLLAYVFFKYVTKTQVVNTGAGSANPKTQVADKVAPLSRLVEIWAEMVRQNIAFSDSFNTTEYPEYQKPYYKGLNRCKKGEINEIFLLVNWLGV